MVRTVIPLVLTVALAGIGVLHFIWAFTPWPMKDPRTFTRRIVGNDDGVMPSAPSALLVGVALFGGAVLTLMANESIPPIGPQWLRLVGMYGLALVLLARGVAGYFMNAGAVEFQRWNSALYSPLCLALGALGGVVAVAASRR
jgi:hypothetical protein